MTSEKAQYLLPLKSTSAVSQSVMLHSLLLHTAASDRGLTIVLQLKQHLLELRQTQESLQEQTQLCNAQEEEILAIQAECVPQLS